MQASLPDADRTGLGAAWGDTVARFRWAQVFSRCACAEPVLPPEPGDLPPASHVALLLSRKDSCFSRSPDSACGGDQGHAIVRRAAPRCWEGGG